MGDPRVAEAMSAVTRRTFLPVVQRRWAGRDHPVSIGRGQTNSQPSTVRAMLELLAVERGHRVLDVGAGSGWTTALLGRLVGPDGRVVGVELEPRLATFGAKNLGRWEMPWASIEVADPHTLGRPDGAPYDRILVSADPGVLPAPLVDQVGTDGVMVIPVGGVMLRLRRVGTNPPVRTEHGYYRFVPLR